MSKSKNPKRKERSTYGLYPKNFPRSVSWAVDQDYTDKLTDEERLWLARFNDTHYGADFRTDYDGEWSKEERRKAYIRKNTANADLYAQLSGAELLQDLEHAPELVATEHEDGSTPKYLDMPEYKDARDIFRRHLTQQRKAVAPVDTPSYRVAKERLESIIRGTEDDDESPDEE